MSCKSGRLAILAGALALVTTAVTLGAEDQPPRGPGQDFALRRVGKKFEELAWEIGMKTQKIRRAKGDSIAPPHLVILIDSTSSACRYLEEFQRHVAEMFKKGPKNLTVSVVALRTQPAVVNTSMVEAKDVRRAIMQVVTEARDSQTRAKVQLKPEQRIQIAAWEDLSFATPDDCVKDWCAGVRFCMKEFGKDYPIDAVCVFTLDNPDTENDIEGLVADLLSAKISLIVCAPETILTTSDPDPVGERHKQYTDYQKLLNIDYGADFTFHRRESAVNEIPCVSGLNGPLENVGNTTGYGYYGLSRAAWATNGGYFLISPIANAQCACMFHGPGDRLTRWLWNDEGFKPPKVMDILNGKAPVAPVIKACEFEAENQSKYFPSLLSRDEVMQMYGSSPYFQYLFSLSTNTDYSHRGWYRGTRWNHVWGEAKYYYGAFVISPWGGKKDPDLSVDDLQRLRISSEYRWPPAAYGTWGISWQESSAIRYAHFYCPEDIAVVKKHLDRTIPLMEAYIPKVREGMPKTPPKPNDSNELRAWAEIEYYIVCLENQLFYLKQYRYYLDVLEKDEAFVTFLRTHNGTAEETKKKLLDAAAVKKGVPNCEIRMAWCLKQRCEEYAKVLPLRGPIYGGAKGKEDLTRLINAKRDLSNKIGQSTWTNFFDLAWMTNYTWAPQLPSGPGGPSPKPKMPLPPSYGDPGLPKTPAGGSQAD